MKKPFLLIAFLCATTIFATDKLNEKLTVDQLSKEKVLLELRKEYDDIKEEVVFSFETIDDFNNYDENQLSDLFNSYDEFCTVTATVKVTYTIEANASIGVVGGSGTTTITVTAQVTASCSEIAAAVKKLKKRLMESIK